MRLVLCRGICANWCTVLPARNLLPTVGNTDTWHAPLSDTEVFFKVISLPCDWNIHGSEFPRTYKYSVSGRSQCHIWSKSKVHTHKGNVLACDFSWFLCLSCQVLCLSGAYWRRNRGAAGQCFFGSMRSHSLMKSSVKRCKTSCSNMLQLNQLSPISCKGTSWLKCRKSSV